MIHPQAVREYLRQVRDSHVWIKELSHKRLDRLLEDQDFHAISREPLDAHQKACVALGLAYPRFAFWLDMGTGKSRITLELLNHFWRKGVLRRAVIVAISDAAVGGWEDEIKKWGFKVPYTAIGNSSTKAKWQSIAEMGAGVIIVTYAGFNYLFSEKKVKVGRPKRKTKKMVPDKKKIGAFAKNLQAFIPDESVHLGNHRSLGFKIAKPLSKDCDIVYALAGVPFGRDPTLMWSQMYLVDKGESLGRILGLFRGAFFTEKKGWFGGYDYKFIKSKEPELSRIMEHRSISYTSAECHDLPKVTPILREIVLPEATYAYFEQAMKAIREARGDRKQIENLFLRMRQLSSGFLGYRNEETGERSIMTFPKNPKLDDLLDNIEDMPYDCKFVIFYEFTHSGRTIMEALTKKGIKAGWLWSGQKFQNRIRREFTDGSVKKSKGLVANWRMAAESLNLQRANYLHYFESPVGVIPRKQSQKRPFRKGQERPGFMYDYVATPTDARILEFHATGEDLFKALFRNPYRTLRG